MKSIDVELQAVDQRFDQFETFLSEVGAADIESTFMAVLSPVARSEDNEPSLEEIERLAAPFQGRGLTFAVRGGEHSARLFAYRTAAYGAQPPFGAFMWLPIHSGLASWWLLTAWRVHQMAVAAVDLARRGFPLPAAACARSLLETAAAARYDAKRWMAMWLECRRFAPTPGEIVPSSLYKPLNDYIIEMLVGGKFRGAMPLDVKALLNEPVQRTNIQTCIDHLARVNPLVAQTYEVLCNAVHPSVASTLTFIENFEAVAPGETQIRFARVGPALSPLSGHIVSTHLATVSALDIAIQQIHETLDEALRALDDLCLTTGVSEYRAATHWRALRPARRNEPCPCRSGRKSKDCPHEWGAEDAATLQDEAIRARQDSAKD